MASTCDFESHIPSFQTLLRRAQDSNGPRPKDATHLSRLYCNLEGPLPETLEVLDTERNADAPKEPYCQTTNPVIWHSISQEPLTTPTASSVSVVIDDWEQYEDNWLDAHEPHADPENELCEFGQLDGEGSDMKLLRCCGTDRPREIQPLFVKASAKPFVTIHDYVSAVHPWLLSLQNRLLWALSEVTTIQEGQWTSEAK